ncbi:helix-turn-helix transcriptional regulator [Acidobacteria bacterium ACD]|nr:MAG: XRE family transcriptional regulator [Acidobacteriota bacterium]MCE7956834.1 XRE family transcriptional regulator [Acidobacteria bacterium ACB2]MDL1949959.1 helix-turn-helix transcriptional regulator [Acidobacteria bacterium ACD]
MKRHPDLVALGIRLRELRAARGWSQEGFAHHCGLDRTYYGGIERGERNVAVVNLLRIARSLDVEVGELFRPPESRAR